MLLSVVLSNVMSYHVMSNVICSALHEQLHSLEEKILHIYDHHPDHLPSRRSYVAYIMWCALAMMLGIILYLINRQG